MNRFAGRNALVTGASRGIGAALAERLAAEGANVVVTARTAERSGRLAGSLADTLERCSRYGTQVHQVVADLGDEAGRAAIVVAAGELLGGRVDILVNNAAAAIYAPLAAFPLRRRRLLFEINVEAPLDLAQAVIPQMVERGEGWIVNLSSATARAHPGPPFAAGALGSTSSVYGATKAALNRLTNGLAMELYGSGVRVNAIEPRAAVMTEGAAALIGGRLSPEQVEPVEAMVEATLLLCECDAERTGGTFVSLDLLAETATPVMTLDGSRPLG